MEILSYLQVLHFVSTNSFKLEMNTFGNYDDGVNAKFYVVCTVKSASGVIM